MIFSINQYETHWLLLLLVTPSPLDTDFIADKNVGTHKRNTNLIGLDSASTGMCLDGDKHIRKLKNHITGNYEKSEVANKFNSDNMILLEPTSSYQNNGYDYGL